jgi:hypothetical protein
MISALERALQRTNEPRLTVPRLYGYGAPVGDDTIIDWQSELDSRHWRGSRSSRLLIRYEAGDPWEPIGRFFLWQAVDPQYVEIEPWIRDALHGPNPRSTGHYCGAGYCLCELKRNRWVGGATRRIDGATWRIYHETGFYATRWWVIQGSRGGHRYRWETTELASVVSSQKGLGAQPPDAGALPYAPFDQRVMRAIRAEKRASDSANALMNLHQRRDALDREDKAEAARVAKALWQWQDEEAEKLWHDGAELLPRYFEDQLGRAPVGHKIRTPDYEQLEERHYARAAE